MDCLLESLSSRAQKGSRFPSKQDKDKTESRAQKESAQKYMLVGRTKYDAPAIKRHPEITHLIELKALNSSINFNMSGRPNQETTTDHNRSVRPHQNETTYDLFEHLFSDPYDLFEHMCSVPHLLKGTTETTYDTSENMFSGP